MIIYYTYINDDCDVSPEIWAVRSSSMYLTMNACESY